MSSATSTGSPRITLVGAGGMAFGPTMANDVIHTPGLRGATLMLHDVNGARLELRPLAQPHVGGADAES